MPRKKINPEATETEEILQTELEAQQGAETVDTAEAEFTEASATSEKREPEAAEVSEAEPPYEELPFPEETPMPEKLEAAPMETTGISDAPPSDRQQFYNLNFRSLDRGLSPEEQQEWNAIYASYRGRSVLSGSIIGIDRINLDGRGATNGQARMYCAVVIPYRVRILIPQNEMWLDGEERPDYVLRSAIGANIDLVVTHVDREGGFALGSRKLAMLSRRYYFGRQTEMQALGNRLKCHMLVVGPRRCLVECWGHDLELTQRDLSFTSIPDLREVYHPGDELDCVVKRYDPATGRLDISVKEASANPFDGAQLRHPEGSRRVAMISGKYAGGVFCVLPDGVVVMCSYSFHYEDSSFSSGDKVIVVIQRYDFDKKQTYGKIVAKW